jgi:hypothetical protein
MSPMPQSERVRIENSGTVAPATRDTDMRDGSMVGDDVERTMS